MATVFPVLDGDTQTGWRVDYFCRNCRYSEEATLELDEYTREAPPSLPSDWPRLVHPAVNNGEPLESCPQCFKRGNWVGQPEDLAELPEDNREGS